jgi:hypothetical protein
MPQLNLKVKVEGYAGIVMILPKTRKALGDGAAKIAAVLRLAVLAVVLSIVALIVSVARG